MDSDEVAVESMPTDLEAGGDNQLNTLTTTTTTTTEPLSPKPSQDKDTIQSVDDEKDKAVVNTNNSNATEAIPPLIEQTEDLKDDNLVDDAGLPGDGNRGGAENFGSGVMELTPLLGHETATLDRVPISRTTDLKGDGLDKSEETREVLSRDVAEENGSDERDEPEIEDAGEDGKDDNEDGEQEQLKDEDDTNKLPAGADIAGSPSNPKRLQRAALYREGLKLQEKEGTRDEALGCYLAAITGLTESEAFTELPQCLHQISNIYFEKKEYEKAVYFIQAEKMYYETALIDIVNLQKELESTTKEPGDDEAAEGQERLPPDTGTGPSPPEVIKAREYENLAKLCLKESKPQLALEYCGKATKMYRELYGDAHPITVGSLDLFTMIYADAGKKLYADAMQKFGVEEEDLERNAEESSQTESSNQAAGEESSTSGLGQRSKNSTQHPANEPSVESTTLPRTEFEPAPDPEEQDDWVTTCLLMLLFFLIVILIILVIAYFYCLGNERSSVCHELKGDLSYWYMRMKHFWLGPRRH